ncbi:MAG: hypothetical protein KJ718_00260 [Nanoarchaeota archaeon]|nr:hypothetical protein [Nanoarchaeota archaeon]
MSKKNLLVLLVSVFALFVLGVSNASAAITVNDVLVNGIGSGTVGVIAGEYLDVEVFVSADATHEDVTIEAWISGDKSGSVETRRFVLTSNADLHRERLSIKVPSNIDPEESLKLNIFVESEDGTSTHETVSLTADRESYTLEILSVDMQPEVSVGDSLVVDVVLKNRGRQFADDTFLRIRIPELGLEEQTYFGDLSPVDQDNPDKEDAVERRTYIRVPANAEPGLYTVELEAFNSDSFDRLERRVLVTGGAVENTMVVTSGQSKTFGTGQTETYTLTLVNRGNVVRVFELIADSPEKLDVEVSEPLIVVPAGSSRTVEVFVDSAVRDEYTFTIDVLSDSGTLIDQKTFRANVEEGSKSEIKANTTVLLTVILAIVFVVLLVVLIVLLTRKPETKEEFGESYY